MESVFVYGTLKYGKGNWAWALSNEEYLGPAVTKDKFLMVDVGFPYVFPKDVVLPHLPEEFLKPVKGDMFSVSPETMEVLDRLEGEGSHYHRMTIETDKGSAWAYVNLSLRGLSFCEPCDTTENGEWVWRG